MLPDWPGQRALAARLLPVMLADAVHAATDEVGAGAVRDRLWALARAGNEYPTGALGEADQRQHAPRVSHQLVAVGVVQAQHGAERCQLCRRRPGPQRRTRQGGRQARAAGELLAGLGQR